MSNGNKPAEQHEEIELSPEDEAALDRANDLVGQEEAHPDNLGSVSERADVIADILGGLGGEEALRALENQDRK
jgi:hypothetical protein